LSAAAWIAIWRGSHRAAQSFAGRLHHEADRSWPFRTTRSA